MNDSQNGYQEYRPSLSEWMWRKLGFRSAFVPPPESDEPEPGFAPGAMITETFVVFDLRGRLRILFGGNLMVAVRTETDVIVGKSRSRSAVGELPPRSPQLKRFQGMAAIGIVATTLLLGCTPAQLSTATKDLAAIEADASALCAAVPTLVTVGDVANLLLPNLATTAALDVARAVAAKCVVIATARNDLAAGGSLSSTAVTLLSDPQAIADLASDVATVKGTVK